ncbi:MAG: helix-turn-helix domain-containing protein, partial [Nitrospiraceae bacterium]
MKNRGWKQVEAAARLGIDQAKVSKLSAGQMAGFSIERLVHFLSLLGQDVEVTVRKAPLGEGAAQCVRECPRRTKYPPLRDLLMQLALTDLFRAKWSSMIHDEWMRALLQNRPDLSTDHLKRTRELMDMHVRDCLVENFEDLIPALR